MSSVRGTSNLLKRYASSAAQAQVSSAPITSLPKEPVRSSKNSQGIKVSTLENYSPIARVAAFVNSGSRDEANNQVGAAHALRVCSSLATRNYSKFGLSRNLNQIGAELTITGSREETVYLLESTRNNLSRGVDILAEIISRPEFRHWEILDAKPRLQLDLDICGEKPELRVVELIHKAAFKHGLAKSLYVPKYAMGNVTGDLLESYRARNVTSDRLTLVGTGMQHDELVKFSDLFRLPEASAEFSRTQSTYLGNEIREENSSSVVHVALAFEGAVSSSKDATLGGLLSHVFGTGGPRIKYSSGGSRVEKATAALASSPSAVSSFNASYSDAGIFGFHVVANKTDVGKVTKGVFRELQSVAKSGVSQQEFARAKNSMKIAVSDQLNNSKNVVDIIAKNGENANARLDVNLEFKSIDDITAADLNAFLKKVAASKPSLAAIGDLSELPYADELAA
jgi:ubiquinol-cytochrome c reductase core subunit 2